MYYGVDENDDPFAIDGVVDLDFDADLPESDDSASAIEFIQKWLATPVMGCDELPVNKKEWLLQDSASSRLRSPRLFEFLILLLRKPHYASYASFVDRSKGVFQIHQPEKVAELWQAVKSRQSNQKMTYDKLARAIRWYYKSNIMQKTNTRYTFQFSSKTLNSYYVDENNNSTTDLST